MSVVSNTSLEYTLREGANALGLDLSEAQITQLLDFLALLQKWNKVYNLTAVRDPQEMLTHHLLDSLAAVPPLRRHVAQTGQGGCWMWDQAGACLAWCSPFVVRKWM